LKGRCDAVSMTPASYIVEGVTVLMKHAGVVARPMSYMVPHPLAAIPANIALVSAGPDRRGSHPTATVNSSVALPFLAAT